MPLTTGLIPAAAVCAVAGAGCVRVLSVAGRRAVAARRAYRVLGASSVVATTGVVLAAGGAVAWSGAGDRSVRLRLAVLLDLGLVVSTGLLLAALLLLPGVVATPRARLRRVLDGLILATCGFYVAWALVVEPLYAAHTDRPPRPFATPEAAAIAVAVLVTIGAAGILVVTVRESASVRAAVLARAAAVVERDAVPAGEMGEAAEVTGAGARHRGAVLVCTFVALATISAATLVGAVLFAPPVAAIAAAAGFAVSQLAVVAVVCSTAQLLQPLPERDIAGFGISVVPLTVAIVASFVRLAFLGSMDDTGLLAGAVIGGLVVGQQILDRSDLRRYADRLRDSEAHFRRMAHTDALTGLANRRQLLTTLHETLYRDEGPPFVLLAIDLDGFKNVNDIRGHDVGDSVLIEVAARLRTNLRPGDLAARLGGDEFAVLMWAGPRESRVVCERLLTVLDRPYELPGATVFLSASIGLAGAATAETVEILMRNADVALRFAKQRGKNRVERYDLAYDRWLRRRNQLEHELRGAVRRDELMLVYQPVVALPEGRVAGVEALLRWHHPRLGPVPPDEFIPVAEEAGLIDGLGAFVLHAACHQLARWLADGHDLYLSVNASVRELHTPEYATRVAEVLRAHRLPPERLVIEVTEHAVALDVDQLVSRLATLRAAGVRVALDDFGSGYSSLGQLRTLPVDILKIDRTLLAAPATDGAAATGPRPDSGLGPHPGPDLGRDRAPRPDRDLRPGRGGPRAAPPGTPFAPALVDVVARLGERLGLDVVAEGVTDPGHRWVLEEAGCRYAQGDLFGRPMPAERVETLFAAPVAGVVRTEIVAVVPSDIEDVAPGGTPVGPMEPTSAQADEGAKAPTLPAQNVGPVDSAHEMRQS